MADEQGAPGGDDTDGAMVRSRPDDRAAADALLNDLRHRLDRLEDDLAAARRMPLWRDALIVGALIVAVGAFGYFAYDRWRTDRVADRAMTAVATVPGLGGYPIDIAVDDATIVARGLAPSQTVRARLQETLARTAAAEGRALRLTVDLPPAAGTPSSTANAALLGPALRQEMAPLSTAVAGAAIRAQDLEDAFAEAAAGAAARQAEIEEIARTVSDVRAAQAATAAAQDKQIATIAADLETRLAAAERQATVLSAEIIASERVTERRAERVTAAQGAMLETLRGEIASAHAAIAVAKTEAAEARAVLAGDLDLRMAAANGAIEAAVERAEAATQTLAVAQTSGEDDARARLEARLGQAADARQALADRVAAAQGAMLETLRGEIASAHAAIAVARTEAAEARAVLAGDLDLRMAAANGAIEAAVERAEAATQTLAGAQKSGLDDARAGLEQAAAARQALADRIAAAASRAQATATALEDLNADHAAVLDVVRQDVAANRAALDTAAAGHAALAAAQAAGLASQDDLAARLETRAAALEDRVADIAAAADARLTALGATVAAQSAQDERAAALRAAAEGRLKAAETRLQGLAGALEDVTGALKRQRTRGDLAAAALADIKALQMDSHAEIVAELDRLKGEQTALSDRLQAMVGETMALGASLSVVNGRVASVAADARALAQVASEVEGIAAETETLTGEVAQLRTTLTARAAAVDKLRSDVSAWQVVANGDAPPAMIAMPAPTAPSEPDPALLQRLGDLEARAGDAIALLDRRIDRIAQEAQPRAASPLQVVQRQLAPLKIHFASLAQPASRDTAGDTLKRVAEIALAMPKDMRIRIIGYADSDGTVEANRITSKRRSDWARDELTRIGVPAERMLSVGRGAERLLSPDASDDSPNRRVEFEAF